MRVQSCQDLWSHGAVRSPPPHPRPPCFPSSTFPTYQNGGSVRPGQALYSKDHTCCRVPGKTGHGLRACRRPRPLVARGSDGAKRVSKGLEGAKGVRAGSCGGATVGLIDDEVGTPPPLLPLSLPRHRPDHPSSSVPIAPARDSRKMEDGVQGFLGDLARHLLESAFPEDGAGVEGSSGAGGSGARRVGARGMADTSWDPLEVASRMAQVKSVVLEPMVREMLYQQVVR